MKRPLAALVFLVSPALAAQDVPLTIERAVQLAVERNERAAIAGTTVDVAEARVRRGRSAFFPRIDVAGNARTEYGNGTERTLATSALLTQTLFDARVFPLYRQLRLERDAARLTAVETRASICRRC